MSDIEDAIDEIDLINRYALEDRDEKRMLEVVAPLAAKLTDGQNYLDADQFADVARFFEESIGDVDAALESGRFLLYGGIEVIRVKAVTRMTVAELAAKTGMNRMTITRLLHKTGLVPEVVGKRKYYRITDLAPLLSKMHTVREE
jgi:hypothetical protein